MKIIKITDTLYPQKLLKVKQPPKQLYVEGNIELLTNPSLAIVGSRKYSEYGEKFAKKFSKDISKYGICIISGLALGIDSIAHENSVKSLGKTIAVIGSGINNIYPTENIELAKSILDNGGCIVSEYEPNTQVNMSNFPKRNRIICGLADSILVVEAAIKSGSTLTGNLGLSLKKTVFCLPRNIGEIKGVGTHDLIKRGAKLVTSPTDILKEYNIDYSNFENIQSSTENSTFKIKDEYKNIYELIPNIPININDLVKKSKLNIIEINTKLTLMEIEGYIKSLPGNEYVRL